MSCIFCRIVDDELPSHRVYEDDQVIALIEITPLERGHVLVIPREHHALLEDMPAALQASLAQAVAGVAQACRAAMGAEATTIAINNGRAAGQEIPHCHVHVIPRREGDGGGPIHALFSGRAAADDLPQVAQAIRELIPC